MMNTISYAAENYIWLTTGEFYKEKTGVAHQLLKVNAGNPFQKNPKKIEALEAFYQLSRVDRYSDPVLISTWEACMLQKKTDGIAILIKSAGVGLARVFVTGKIDGKRCFGQADIFVFGKDTPPKNREKYFSTAPQWPQEYPLAVMQMPNYWPQTEKEIQFLWENRGVAKSPVKVLDRGKVVAQIPFAEFISYTPPRDSKLNQLETGAWKDIIFLTTSEKGTCSFTTIVHRNRTSGNRLLPGVAVFLGSALATFFVILYHRKRKRENR